MFGDCFGSSGVFSDPLFSGQFCRMESLFPDRYRARQEILQYGPIPAVSEAKKIQKAIDGAASWFDTGASSASHAHFKSFSVFRIQNRWTFSYFSYKAQRTSDAIRIPSAHNIRTSTVALRACAVFVRHPSDLAPWVPPRFCSVVPQRVSPPARG